MTAFSFAFTKLVVHDLALAEQFYGEVFGMKRTGYVTAENHAYALEEAILSLGEEPGAHTLILTRYLQRPPPPAGAAWTGFVVADIEASLDAVRRAGGTIEVPPHENADHGVIAAIVADPEGHPIEVIQILTKATA